MSARVSYEDAEKFLRRCRARPERMRVLCSTKASRDGGDELAVDVEVAPGGPVVQVREISMARGWTGCRFSPSALWLALALARRFGGGSPDPPEAAPRRRALELGCGVALAGLTAHALGFDTTLTDILAGHLESLAARASADAGAGAELRVRCLDWLEAAGPQQAQGVDLGSPENVGAAQRWERLGDDERHSFDLVMASDVLYEAHHARLLPVVVERFLRPGGRWLLSLAIRDGPMMADFLRHLHRSGVLGTAPATEDPDHPQPGSPCAVSWETACVPERCAFCGGGRGGPGSPRGATLAELCELVEAHEGGAVLLEGRRPVELKKN